MNSRALRNKILHRSTWIVFSCLVAIWIFYFLFGHRLIDAVYSGESAWIQASIMRGAGVTARETYYEKADEIILTWTLWALISFSLFSVLIMKPIGAILAFISFISFSFFLFCLFELFPSLIKPLHLDTFPYYFLKYHYLADDELAYRGKPFVNAKYSSRGDLYSPLYGIEMPPMTVDELTDGEGFGNSRATRFSDVVVIGDSYIEDGINEADTFPKRLESNLPGLTVTNLGKGGYGPIHYLEVLKRYGIKKHPKYALLSFYEGNDSDDIMTYLQWKGKSGGYAYARVYDALSSSFLRRYTLALTGAITHFRNRIWHEIWPAARLAFDRIRSSPEHTIHPEVALLNIAHHYYKVVLPVVKDNTQSTKEWEVLKKTLTEFKTVCTKNHIVPIIIYIPAAAHIYAEYTMEQSGKHWLEQADQQITVTKKIENAVRHLSQELDIEFINLTPLFEKAAKEGKLLYYPLDSHWNSDGKEVAARFAANILKSKFIGPANELK